MQIVDQGSLLERSVILVTSVLPSRPLSRFFLCIFAIANEFSRALDLLITGKLHQCQQNIVSFDQTFPAGSVFFYGTWECVCLVLFGFLK